MNGAICTLITSILLLYLVGVAFAEQLIDPTFVHSFHYNVQNMTNPDPYNVTAGQMIVLSNITNTGDWTFPEGTDLDSYFGGVYVQVDYVNEGDDPDQPQSKQFTYSLPTDCAEVFPDATDTQLDML